MTSITLLDTDILIDAGLNDKKAIQVLLDLENNSALESVRLQRWK